MTLRQVVKFLRLVGHLELVEFYEQSLSYRMAAQKELPSLEEFIALASNKDKDGNAPKVFDEKADKFLEAEAMKRLAERQKQNGR